VVRGKHSWASRTLGIAALVHGALFLVWRGTTAQLTLSETASTPEPSRLSIARQPLVLATVSLVSLPSELQPAPVPGADDTWRETDGTASPTRVVAPGQEQGRLAPGPAGTATASFRDDDSSRSSGLWNGAKQVQALHGSRAPSGKTTPEKIERADTAGYANRRIARRQATPGEDADRAGLEEGTGLGGTSGSEGREWLAADPLFDSAPKATRVHKVAAVAPNAEAPRRQLGSASTENSEKGRATQWASAAELSSRTRSSPFDLGASSAGGETGLGAEGVKGKSVASQGGQGRAAASGSSVNRGAAPTRATRGNPYFYAMYRRIDKQLKFPRKLALALEQGEVVLRFRLDASGKVHGLTVDKGSEFSEFDKEALRAFKAAGPFGAVPKGLLAGRDRVSVIAPYYFRNPLIR
jgi:TonB family protein